MASPIEPGPAVRAPSPSPQTYALCLLMCAALQIMENLLPRLPVFPWLKLGLSHVILLPFLLRFGPTAACMLLLGRNLMTLIFAGQPLTTFLISNLSGSLTLLVGGFIAVQAYRRGALGLAGVGMLLAALMNLSQLAVVEGMFIHHRAFYFQLAPMLGWSVVSGAIVACLAYRSRTVLDDLLGGEAANPLPETPAADAPLLPAPFVAALGAMLGLFLIRGPAWQGLALAGLLAASLLRGRGWAGLRADMGGLLRAWPWFIYLAWLHLLLGDGEFLFRDWITRQGARDFLFYGARLASLILLGPWLAETFPRRWLAASPSVYARGMLGCLPLLPGLHTASLKAGRAFFRSLRSRGETAVLKDMLDEFRILLGEKSPTQGGSTRSAR